MKCLKQIQNTILAGKNFDFHSSSRNHNNTITQNNHTVVADTKSDDTDSVSSMKSNDIEDEDEEINPLIEDPKTDDQYKNKNVTREHNRSDAEN